MVSRSLLALLLCVLVGVVPASAEPLAYVTNQGSNAVHVIRPSDGVLMASIPVGQAPTGIAIPAVGGFAYVANRGDNTVSRIDLATQSVVATIPVAGNPTAVGILPDGSEAYVVQSTDCADVLPSPTPTPLPSPTPVPSPLPSPTPPPATVRVCHVAVIDAASDSVVATIEVGDEPFDVAIAPSGGFAYVTNRADDTLAVIDTTTRTVVGLVEVGETPEGVAARAGEIYVANDAGNTITVIRELDLQVLGTVDVGAGPLGVAAAPDGSFAIVGNDDGASVTVFAMGTQEIVGEVVVGSNPAGIAFLPDSSRAMVANSTSGSVSLITLEGLTTVEIPLVGSPAGVAIAPEPALRLTKVATPAPAPAGGTVDFGLTYGNVGTGPAVDLVLTDIVPEHLTFVSATAGGVLTTNAITLEDEVVWTIPTLPEGGSGTVFATFAVASPLPQGTTVLNQAELVETASGLSATAEETVAIDSYPVYDLNATAPNPFVAGGSVTYTVAWANLGTAESLGTELEVDWDPALTLVSAVPPPSEEDDTWFLGNVAPGASGTFTITLDIGSPLANGSVVESLFKMSDARGNPVTVSAVNTVQSAPQLSLAIQDLPDPAPAGGVALYEITWSNPGTDTATGVVLDLVADPALVFVGSDLAPDTGTTDRWTIGDVAAGSSGRLRVQLQLPAVVANGTVFSTQASVADDAGNNASATATTTAQSSPALAAALSESADPVLSGTQLSYDLVISNTGSDVAAGLTATLALPGELLFVSATPAPDAGTTDTWTLPDLAAGGSTTVSVVAEATAPNGSLATVTGGATDALGHSTTAVQTTVIDLIPALALSMTAAPEPVFAGGELEVIVDYVNHGTLAANGVVLQASLPPGVTFVGSAPAPDQALGGTWTVGTLAPGASGQVVLRGAVDAAQQTGSLLAASASIQDDAATSATASSLSTVVNPGAIALEAGGSPAVATPGSEVSYTIAWANPGVADLADVEVALGYDPGVTFVAASLPPLSASNDRWSVGAVPAGGGGLLVVTVDLDGGLVPGARLGTEVTLTAGGVELGHAVVLTDVSATADLSLEITSPVTAVGPADSVPVEIHYRNDGAAALGATELRLEHGAAAAVVGSLPVADSGETAVWTVPSLAPGEAGTIAVDLVASLQPGAIFRLGVSGTSGAVSAGDTLLRPAAAAVEPKISWARWDKRLEGSRGHKGKFRWQALVDLGEDFDGTGLPVNITVSTPSGLLFAIRIPSGLLADTQGRGRTWKLKSETGLTSGRYLLLVSKQKSGVWKVRFTSSKVDLPLADSAELTLGFSLGDQSFVATRVFTAKGQQTPDIQRLRYRGD